MRRVKITITVLTFSNTPHVAALRDNKIILVVEITGISMNYFSEESLPDHI
jgi:hypothetical protein